VSEIFYANRSPIPEFTDCIFCGQSWAKCRKSVASRCCVPCKEDTLKGNFVLRDGTHNDTYQVYRAHRRIQVLDPYNIAPLHGL
jgi:hypothetical protein